LFIEVYDGNAAMVIDNVTREQQAKRKMKEMK
jgi:hypothetical protein